MLTHAVDRAKRVSALSLAAMLLAMLLEGAAALTGCKQFSVNDLETTPAEVLLDGLEGTAATVTEDYRITAAESGEVVCTFARGAVVGYIGLADDGLACVRVGSGEDAFVCLVDPAYLRIAGSSRTAQVKHALLGATDYADFACETDPRVLAAGTRVTVYDEVGGVLVVRADGDQRDRYMLGEGLTDEACSWTSRVDASPVHAGVLARDAQVVVLGDARVGGVEYLVVLLGADGQPVAADAAGAAEAAGAAAAGAAGVAGYPALVPAWLVREGATPSSPVREGYAVYNAIVYSNALLEEGIATPEVDTRIVVLDEFAGVAFVELPDGTRGYMPAGDVTDTANYVAPARPRGGGSGGGGGGGNSGGGGGGSSSGGVDGEDISLIALGRGATQSRGVYQPGTAVLETGNYVVETGRGSHAVYVAGQDDGIAGPITDTGKLETDGAGLRTGVVLSPDTPVYWALLDRGDAFHVSAVDEGAGVAWVQLAGRTGWVSLGLLREAGAPVFEARDLFCDDQALIYDDFGRRSVVATAARNDVIHVIDEYGEGVEADGYVIQVGEGAGAVLRYIAKSVTSDTQYEVPPAPAPRGGGGGGSGGGGGGGGNSGGGGGGDYWTEPVL